LIQEAIEQLRDAAYILLEGDAGDYDALLRLVGDARLVLIGAASHGSHELFHARAHITRRLIGEKGFTAVALGADAPSTMRVNSYVRGASEDASGTIALRDFSAYPNWLWRNAEMLDFIGWLRDYNDHFPRYTTKVGVYGLDLYNLHGSRRLLQTIGSEDVLEMQRKAFADARRRNSVLEDEPLYAGQQVRLTSSGSAFYRVLPARKSSWWNLYSTHQADALDALMLHLTNQGRPAKIVAWEHLSGAGDARATEAAARGEWNLGQRMRERHARQVHLIGLTTCRGSITAAEQWGLPPRRMRLCPALDDSFESLLHALEVPRFGLPLKGLAGLAEWWLERCVGFVYRPETERDTNVIRARPAEQLDQVVFFDESRSIEPLDPEGGRI
jgi:erythromycin esterase-like protein